MSFEQYCNAIPIYQPSSVYSSQTDSQQVGFSDASKNGSAESLCLDESNYINDIQQIFYDVFAFRGYIITEQITTTLQGCILKAKYGVNGKEMVIKSTSKLLHNSRSAMFNKQQIHGISEDILKEMKLLKYLTYNFKKCDDESESVLKNMVSYLDFFEDSNNYYLAMENGGTSLFDFVNKIHQLISHKKLSIIEWQKKVQQIFKQMVQFIDVLHNKMNVCHLDISLENLLINNILIGHSLNDDQIHFINEFNIKYCDFGLAEYFDIKNNPKFKCNKFVGKKNYKSPEIYSKKKIFNAKSSDVWSLGICLFALLIGSFPFNNPSNNDNIFKYVINGKLDILLKSWNKLHYLTPDSLDLLTKIFKLENSRITTKEILEHPFLVNMIN